MPQSKDLDVSTKQIFEEAPVKKALAAMIIPTIVSQLILVVYNMADTWYVGRTGNADAVAAVSLCLPVYTILSAISNLFGIGGASAIARAFGIGDQAQAKQAFSLASCGAVCTAILYAVLIQCFSKPLLLLIGADGGDIAYAVGYTRWTIVIGAVPTILAPSFAHMIRAAGHARTASFGMILGALLNIALDPLFMFVFLKPGNEVAGAAIATVISNTASLIFFLGYMALHRETTSFPSAFSKMAAMRKSCSMCFAVESRGLVCRRLPCSPTAFSIPCFPRWAARRWQASASSEKSTSWRMRSIRASRRGCCRWWPTAFPPDTITE